MLFVFVFVVLLVDDGESGRRLVVVERGEVSRSEEKVGVGEPLMSREDGRGMADGDGER